MEDLLLWLSLKIVGFSWDDVFIYADGSGKFRTSAVVIVYGPHVIPLVLPYEVADNSALAELAALQVSLLLAKYFVKIINNKVQVRCDNKGVIQAFKNALLHKESNYPICKRFVDFVRDEEYISDYLLSKVKVRWCRGHSGESLNELVDYLARHKNLDNVYEVKFKYFEQVRNF